jgi:hypothetical protein
MEEEEMNDAEYVRLTKEKWAKVLDLFGGKQDTSAGAIAVALWATLHVDKLIEIAERKSA